jgi:hypothetical protein
LLAGGDTSSQVTKVLRRTRLSMAARLTEAPPVPLRGRGGCVDGLEVALKGGQAGDKDFFKTAMTERAERAVRRAPAYCAAASCSRFATAFASDAGAITCHLQSPWRQHDHRQHRWRPRRARADVSAPRRRAWLLLRCCHCSCAAPLAPPRGKRSVAHARGPPLNAP